MFGIGARVTKSPAYYSEWPRAKRGRFGAVRKRMLSDPRVYYVVWAGTKTPQVLHEKFLMLASESDEVDHAAKLAAALEKQFGPLNE